MNKYKLLTILMLISIVIFVCSSCSTNCKHVYSIHKTVEATCTEEGYYEYKCSECWDKYKEIIPAKGHKAGEAPTLDASQNCVNCGTVLAEKVNYMPYRCNDLAINQYYRFASNYVTTKIVTQNQERYVPKTIQYVDKNGGACYLTLSVPVQDFFKHDVKSMLALATKDGKSFSTDSGFKVEFAFDSINKDLESIHAWDYGLKKEFKNSDMELLKVVGEYQARPAFYNTIYEIVDYSNCYIEIAKQTESGYEIVKRIDSKDDWKTILKTGTVDISAKNGSLFYEAGTYRVLFKYNMTWVTDPPSGVYELNDVDKINPIYPYGKINDQYEFFYVTITEGKSNILLPSKMETPEGSCFCQVRALVVEEKQPFIEEYSTLNFGSDITFKVGAKVDMDRTGFFYNKRSIKDFRLVLSVYNSNLDKYDKYKEYDLNSMITTDTVYGEELTINIDKESAIRDKKCKMSVMCSFFDETTGKTITERYDYNFILYW